MSFVSNTFYCIHHHYITYYKYLYPELTDKDNIYMSPLYDILCILYTFWGSILKKIYDINDNLFEKIQTYIKNIEINKIVLLSEEYIDILYKLFNLFRLLYDVHIFFYKIQKYFKDNKLLEFIDIRIIKYIYCKLFNNFELHKFPEYMISNDKLRDDYDFFDKFMQHMLNFNYRYTLFTIEESDYDDILIIYFENMKYDEKYLFEFMNAIYDYKKYLNIDYNKNKKIIEHILTKFDKYIDELGNTVLHYAIIFNLSQNIIDNFSEKVDINNINNDGNNVLYDAIIMKNEITIKKLLDKNININLINEKSILYLCIENNILNEEILEIIINRTIVNPLLTSSPTLMAIYKNVKWNIIDKMIDKYDIKNQDDNGNNILMQLVKSCNDNYFKIYWEYINLMIDKFDINHKNKNGENILALLLNNKLSLYNALIKNYKLILIKKLIEKNIDLICKDIQNTSLLILAIKNQLPNDLLKKFINPDTINVIDKATTYNGLIFMITYISTYNFDASIIKQMIENGANKKYLTKNMSALTYSLSTNNIDIIKLVIDDSIINVSEQIYLKDLKNNFMDINEDNVNVTILDRSLIENNNINIIGLLLLHGVHLLKRHILEFINRFTINECIELFKINLETYKYNLKKIKGDLKIKISTYKNFDKNNYDKYINIYEKYKIIKKKLKILT